METPLELIYIIAKFVGNYTPILAFIGGLVLGWEVFAGFAFLAAQGDLSGLWVAFIFFFLGTVIEDAIWFILGKRFLRKKIEKIKNNDKEVVKGFIHRLASRNYFLTIFFSKTVFATKHFTFIYLATKHHLRIRTFLMYDIISNLILLTFAGIAGWIVGKGFSSFIQVYKDINWILLSIALFVILLYSIKILVRKVILKKLV